MSNLLKSKFLLGVMVVAAFAVTVGVSAPSQAAASCSITTTLRVGSKGPEVSCLQTAVGVKADGSFGPKTKTAVMNWQTSVGLTADGVFGPKSIAKWSGATSGGTASGPCTGGALFNSVTGASCSGGSSFPAGCSAGTLFSSTTGMSCSGGTSYNSSGAGNIASVTLNGSPSNIQVGEGTSGVAVLGFQVRADAGSNLNIQNVRVNLVATGSGSTWPSRYIQGISVWEGSTKVGSVGVSGLSQNGTIYNATIALSGAVVNANSTSNFSVSVDANSSIDTNDANNTFNVYVDSIRYSDASGAILTSSVTGITQPMRFLKLSSSASVKLTLSEDIGNPKDRTVVTNPTSTTNDVSLLKFNLIAAGSDMVITKIALPVTATGVSNASSISAYYKLKYNGSVVSSFTLTGTGTTPVITFGDTSTTNVTNGTSTALNGGVGQIVITNGSQGNFEVVADIKAMPNSSGDAAAFDSGDTLKVDYPSSALTTITGVNTAQTVVQDQTGSALATSSTNRTGSATGYAATFRIQGVSANYVSNSWNSPVAPTRNTSGVLTSETATTTVTVTAVGNDFFINKTADYVPNTTLGVKDSSANTSYGFNLAILNGSDQYVTTTEVTAASVSPSVSCTSGCIQQGISLMKIPSGTTATFVISTALTDNSSIAAGGYKVAVFSTTASPNSDGSSPAAYTNTPSYNFVTSISDTFQ